MKTELAQKKCIPCSGEVPKLSDVEIEKIKKELHPEWQVDAGHHLERTFLFPDFKAALVFTNRVGELAESEGHHPDIFLAWGKVKITIFTHKINGLTESDFILAAKIDQL